MQVALGKTGYFLITGIIRTEPKRTDCKNGSERCTAGAVVEVRRDQDGNAVNDEDGRPVSVWANITAWGVYAKVLSSAQKGDGILAVGTIRTWEQDGKSYKSLSVNNHGYLVLSYPMQPDGPAPAVGEGQQFQDLGDDDGELPF